MPGGDRTGPAGQGPLTGRGMGYCSDNNRDPQNNNFQRPLGRGGFFGRGSGRGRGRGRGFGPFFNNPPQPPAKETSEE